MRTRLFTVFLSFQSFFYSQLEFNYSLGGALGIFVQSNYFNIPLYIQYNPRLDYVFHPEFSVSLTSYPSVTPMPFFDTRYNLPLLLQLNFGTHASRKAHFDGGCFVAAGFTRFGTVKDYYYHKPCFSFGIKAGDERSITFKVDFIPNKHTYVGGIPYTQFTYSDIFIFGLLYNFSRGRL